MSRKIQVQIHLVIGFGAGIQPNATFQSYGEKIREEHFVFFQNKNKQTPDINAINNTFFLDKLKFAVCLAVLNTRGACFSFSTVFIIKKISN